MSLPFWPMWFPAQRCVYCTAPVEIEDAIGVLLLDWADTHGDIESGALRHADTEVCKAVLS